MLLKLIDPSNFHGIIVPTLTPFIKSLLSKKLVVDITSQDKDIERLFNAGCHAIFLGSYAGEGRFIDMSNWRRSIKAGAKKIYQLGHHIPIMVGVLRDDIKQVIECAEFAERNGADAIVFAPLLGGNPEDIQVRLSLLKKAIRLPIILYNNPKDFGGNNLPEDFIEKVVRDSQIVGIKDSSGNTGSDNFFNFLIGVMKDHQHFHVFQGSTIKAGYGLLQEAWGLVPREAEIDPKLFVSFFEIPLKPVGDQKKIETLRLQINNGGGNKYIKEELKKLGIFKTSLMYSKSL